MQIHDPQTGEIREATEYEVLTMLQNLEANVGTRLDANGHEVLDPMPMALPTGMKAGPTMEERLRRMIQNMSVEAEMQGAESFEESEDFDIPDDMDIRSPYEEFYDELLQRHITPQEFEKNADKYLNRYMKAEKEKYNKLDMEGFIEENVMKYQARRKADEKSNGGDRVGGDVPKV